MRKNPLAKQNLITLQETIPDNFEPVSDGWSLYELNEQWKNYWYNYFLEQFKYDSMFKEVLELKRQRELLVKSIKDVAKERDKFLEENIKLGEIIEKLKHEYKLRLDEIKELRRKIGKKPKGFLDATGKLIAKNIQMKNLKEECEKLKENQNQMSAISENIVDEILILKVKGLKNTEIAEKTGVSQSTVSRYISKNESRLREIEYSLLNK